MSAYKTNAEQIEAIEEKQKKLASQLKELKYREQKRNAVKYRRVCKKFLEDFTELTIDDVQADNDEEAEEFVKKIMSDALAGHGENIEQKMRAYLDGHEFGILRTDENGGNYAEQFDFSSLLVKGSDGQYHSIDLLPCLLDILNNAPQDTI